MSLHYKTKLALDLNISASEGCNGGGGSDESGYTYRNEKNEDIVNIPMEAQQFLEMASTLIHKADILIRQKTKK
jgi:hypothetical protein